MCKGNLSWVSLARSVTRPQATGFALQNRTNTKKDTQKRVFFRVGTPDWIRTSGLQSRSLSLYPTELRARMQLRRFSNGLSIIPTSSSVVKKNFFKKDC